MYDRYHGINVGYEATRTRRHPGLAHRRRSVEGNIGGGEAAAVDWYGAAHPPSPPLRRRTHYGTRWDIGSENDSESVGESESESGRESGSKSGIRVRMTVRVGVKMGVKKGKEVRLESENERENGNENGREKGSGDGMQKQRTYPSFSPENTDSDLRCIGNCK